MEMIYNDKTIASPHERLKDYALFLTDYAAQMLACGTTTIRIEKNVERIARTYNTTAEITIFPSHIMMTVWDAETRHSYTNNAKIKGGGLNFQFNTDLSRLSWDIVDEHLSLDEAKTRYKEIVAQPRMNKWLVLLLVGLANASFCRLFDGDWPSMAIVFIATIDGFYLKNKLHGDWGWDLRIATILAAMFSAVISCSGYVFHIGHTPEIALATSVLYLVPGIPFINSVSDLIHGHYICFLSRCIQATVLTICLSLGLCLGLIIMNVAL